MGKMSKIKSEKFTFFTFWMTICIIVYHTAPHLLVMAGMGGYDRKFIETLGPIALNYFFATSAYFFFSSEHCFVFKMKKRIKTVSRIKNICVHMSSRNTAIVNNIQRNNRKIWIKMRKQKKL